MSSQVTRADLDKVHERFSDFKTVVNDKFTELTVQVSRLATIMEERSRPEPVSPWKRSAINAAVDLLKMGFVGLLMYWIVNTRMVP